MKKAILLISALSVGAASMMALKPAVSIPDQAFEVAPMSVATAPAKIAKADANQTIEFRYYSDDTDSYNALSMNGVSTGGTIYEAVEMPATTVNSYVGSKITGITIYTAAAKSNSKQNYVNNATIFLTHDLEETPFYTQDVTLPTALSTKTTITLDTPYEFEKDQPVFFGYYFKLTRNIINYNYYIPTDGAETTQYDMEGGYIGYKTSGNPSWQAITASGYGNFLIGALVEGKLPTDELQALDLKVPAYAPTGQEFQFEFNVKNRAANAINTVEVAYSVNDGTPTTTTVDLEKPLEYNMTAAIKIKAVCPVQGASVPVKAEILKINGVDNNYTGQTSATAGVYSLLPGNGFKQNVLIEEGTGTWCPNCPLGLLTMEWAKKKYTDGSVVLVGAHNGDEMSINAYQEVLDWGISGFPQYMANRKYTLGFYQSQEYNQLIFEDVVNTLTEAPAFARIDLYLSWGSDDRNSIEVATQSVFALPSNGNYRVSLILVEDGIGPYKQSNNLYNLDGFGVFSTGGSSVSWTFDDVARALYGTWGLPASQITNPKAGEFYTFNYDMPVTALKNLDKSRVVAVLLDADTYEVVNVVEKSFSEATSVGELAADTAQVSIRAELGAVVVNGAAVTEVYTIDGRRAATAYGEATINLPAGLYVVKADDTVRKVIVK